MSRSSSQGISHNSPIETLFSSKKSKTLESLKTAGINTVYDLMWLLPLRLEKIPPLLDFTTCQIGSYFRGVGYIRDIQKRSNPNARGKGNIPLINLTVNIKDYFSDSFLNLKWFNAYPSIVQKIEKAEALAFLGKVQEFNNSLQILNPEITTLEPSELAGLNSGGQFDLKIQYPTINKTKGFNIKKAIDKIPPQLWDEVEDLILEKRSKERDLLPLSQSFKILHGQQVTENEDLIEKAKERLIFEEFFIEQAKLFIRRQEYKESTGALINSSGLDTEVYFPHPFTEDQSKVLREIISDLSSGRPMMRMVQGDVGCGKTWVAFASSLVTIKNGFQSALMCPTESLARQHFAEARELFSGKGLEVELLLGSTKAKEKDNIYQKLAAGEINLIIGTHALIQDSVSFKSLGLAIIDEQHKFGVNQRLKLISKSNGCHCLIMSATPIPRSLSLTQYGDLDMSIIKSSPSQRAGFKTRIVNEENFEKFLSFIKTRLTMEEQVYIVVPAIEDNELLDLHNLEEVFKRFKQFFPEASIKPLHGKMSPLEKDDIFHEFGSGDVDVLIATSVVEVGINVPNATIMAILNPERFGLSSLHQLRGRVGRGEKPGFCFLVLDGKISKEATERLQFIEQTDDGFKIAEQDLINRGRGDILGKDQSGNDTYKKLANPILHYDLLNFARSTLQEMSASPDEKFMLFLESVAQDKIVHQTI